MKHFIFFTILLAITSCTRSTKKDIPEKTDSVNVATSGLPAIDIVTIAGDSIRFNTVEGRAILVLFTPDCDHCQREAADISAHFELFQDYRLYFVASQTPDVINDFAVKYHLSDKPGVVFAQSGIEAVVTILKPTSMPTILIYDANGSLVKRFDGETNVETIREFL